MIHFAMLDRLPGGVTVEMMARDVAAPFQHGTDYLKAGDPDAAGQAFGKLPEWMGDVVYLGGPAYFSLDLEPGDYAFVAEVPDPQEHGLLLRFSVEE